MGCETRQMDGQNERQMNIQWLQMDTNIQEDTTQTRIMPLSLAGAPSLSVASLSYYKTHFMNGAHIVAAIIRSPPGPTVQIMLFSNCAHLQQGQIILGGNRYICLRENLGEFEETAMWLIIVFILLLLLFISANVDINVMAEHILDCRHHQKTSNSLIVIVHNIYPTLHNQKLRALQVSSLFA